GGDDEGRALMQVVHTIAPAASLAFHDGGSTPADLAKAINALVAAGCNVIVDDVDDKVTDAMFQLDDVAAAGKNAVNNGVVYVAASGDSDSNGYQAPWTPMSGSYGGVALTDAQSFGGSLVQTITVPGNAAIPLTVGWDQPVTDPASTMKVLVFSA